MKKSELFWPNLMRKCHFRCTVLDKKNLKKTSWNKKKASNCKWKLKNSKKMITTKEAIKEKENKIFSIKKMPFLQPLLPSNNQLLKKSNFSIMKKSLTNFKSQSKISNLLKSIIILLTLKPFSPRILFL